MPFNIGDGHTFDTETECCTQEYTSQVGGEFIKIIPITFSYQLSIFTPPPIDDLTLINLSFVQIFQRLLSLSATTQSTRTIQSYVYYPEIDLGEGWQE